MNWNLPGTVIPAKRADAPFIEQSFSAMFMAGGIALGQVANITGLEPYTIQNWVKREFLPPPDHKRYNMNQLCRIITINMLKSVLTMERICFPQSKPLWSSKPKVLEAHPHRAGPLGWEPDVCLGPLAPCREPLRL